MKEAKKETPELKFIGKATKEQIEGWKLQYGLEDGDITEIEVEAGENEIACCYLKPANRDQLSVILSRYDQSMSLEAGEFALENCWLGGDERLRKPIGLKQERMAVRASQLAYAVVSLPAGNVKKK
jgi:hypothetical protein